MKKRKNLLLAVTGSSPAVVTETLYGINHRGDAWPDELRIITTEFGEKKAWQGLHDEGHLNALCKILNKPLIPFSRDDILVVPGADGKPVNDARSEDDHEALANFIMARVRDYTADDTTSIHASIAGGRKTMTFYLGYAMSMFGRHHDCLSHVLISDGYESNPEFYYPTSDDVWINNNAGQRLNTREAKVTLADIPFIRQRNLVPELVKEMKRDINFRKLVELINIGEQPEKLLLNLYIKEQCIELSTYSNSSSHAEPLASIQIKNPLFWALYVLIAKDSREPVGSRGNYPRPKANVPDAELVTELLIELKTILGIEIEGGNGKLMVKNLLKNMDDANLRRGLEALDDIGGVTNNNFSSYLNDIQSEILENLPRNLAHALKPKPLYDPEEDYDNSLSTRATKRRKKNVNLGYGFDLPDPANQIRIIE